MAKTYIDIPTVGYTTWLITTGYINKDGVFIEDEDSDFIKSLNGRYPYDGKHEHIR